MQMAMHLMGERSWHCLLELFVQNDYRMECCRFCKNGSICQTAKNLIMDTNMNIENLIEEYLKTQIHDSKERSIVRKLLCEGSASFLALYHSLDNEFAYAVQNSVRSYEGDKHAAIIRYKRYINWLSRRLNVSISISWPPVDISNRFERIIKMLQIMQEKPRNFVQEIEDRLWISERTIEGDLSSIQYDDSAENSFLNQSFKINGLRRARGTVEFMSSVHPILLLENLTSVSVMLQSLLEKATQPDAKEWALCAAAHIWNQLTEYAQTKVIGIFGRTYPTNSREYSLFEEIRSGRYRDGFIAEQEMHEHAIDQFMYCLKMNALCIVRYVQDDQEFEVTGWAYGIIDEAGGSMIQLTDKTGDILKIPTDDIVYCGLLQDEAGLQ